jgi:hypothetical protein
MAASTPVLFKHDHEEVKTSVSIWARETDNTLTVLSAVWDNTLLHNTLYIIIIKYV